MISSSILKAAKQGLAKCRAKRCWHVACGGSAGSSFDLALGRKIRRQGKTGRLDRLLPKSLRKVSPELSLMVWCSWRLSTKDKVLVTSDDCDNDRKWCNLLQILVGRRITHVEIINALCDLQISFGRGYRLDIFCDYGNKSPTIDTNWELFSTLPSGETQVEFSIPSL